VHLGVELGDVTTKASLADAFVLALERTGAMDKSKKNKAALKGLKTADDEQEG
jgi:hypothetical protein